MFLINALRDFADGLSRGFELFFTERNDHVERTLMLSSRSRNQR